MDIFVNNVNLRRIISFANPKLPKARTGGAFMTVGNACSLSMLLILGLTSCTKNSQPRLGETRKDDTVTNVQELRDSISRSLLISEDVAPREKAKGDAILQEKGSMQSDTLVGTVYVSGNEPFTRLTLALEDGRSRIFLEADTIQSKQLRKLQGRVVRVSGSIVKSGLGDYIHVNEFVMVH
jgi:hypothetical protein